ncbi:hypothetical protein AAHA92_17542 [Salvia divinorum]|uniref:Uncharacterized protein n=1 Tax=Salvia divinorum TaxID=28513 RepID=A0ABD1GZL9_SALDI
MKNAKQMVAMKLNGSFSRNHYPRTGKAILSVGCVSEHAAGTSENAINVEDIVKSVVTAYIECGDDEVCLAAFVNKFGTNFGNNYLSRIYIRSLFNKTSTSKHYAKGSRKMKIDVEKMIANYRASD